jgi:tetratricopeptide (TPR) repeat protein
MSPDYARYSVSEEEYIDAILTEWPYRHGHNPTGEALLELLDLAEEAVAAYPLCAQLWDMRGDLILLGTEEAKYELDDALRSYQRAVEVDPSFAQAYESIGYYHDVHTEDFPGSELAFRKAVELGAGEKSDYGLARVLVEQGKR